MRVTNQLISTLNACTVYNEGVSRVVMLVACNANKTIEVLKKENKERPKNLSIELLPLAMKVEALFFCALKRVISKM